MSDMADTELKVLTNFNFILIKIIFEIYIYIFKPNLINYISRVNKKTNLYLTPPPF
jgi:hypothetical protein